jgi:poly(A) polymerase
MTSSKTTQAKSLGNDWIDREALDIIRRLQGRGFKTLLVGGCIRDHLCGITPKDFDIATSAQPNQVRKSVFGAYVIGRRFRLVLVKRGDQQFEVATFRRAGTIEDTDESNPDEVPAGENFFGTPEEDAARRDFSINALFYDPIAKEIIDYLGAMNEIESRTLKMIGNAKQRIEEDPIRALRALRLSHKIGFVLDPELRTAIQETAELVGAAVLPRKREEFLKILKLPEPGRVFAEMLDLGLIKTCLPTLQKVLEHPTAADRFYQGLARTAQYAQGSTYPTDWYLPFLLAMQEASIESPLSDDDWDQLTRVEMGIFKAEMSEIEFVDELVGRLESTEVFLKRGARRQAAFLSQPGLPSAIRLAEFNYEISPTQLAFWNDRMSQKPSTV